MIISIILSILSLIINIYRLGSEKVNLQIYHSIMKNNYILDNIDI